MLDRARLRLAKAIAPSMYGAAPNALASQAVAVTPIDMNEMAARLGGPNLVSSLGPGLPLGPAHPEEVEPRRWDYAAGYNTQVRPRAYEPITFETLKALGRNYDVAALAREKRIDDFRQLEWTVRPKAIKGEKRNDRLSREKRLADDINKWTGFWQTPDQERSWYAWIYAYLDQLFLTDANALYLRMTKGGDLYAVEVVDGTTILPIIDLWGRIPAPPLAAYRQIIKGMPWTYQARTGTLADGNNTFSTSQMSYDPFWTHADSVYGHPPMEWVVLAVNRALRRQTIDLARYTEGTTVEAMWSVPENWSNQQIQELQKFWDGLFGGNDPRRVGLKFVPGGNGAGLHEIHPEVKPEVEEWLMMVTCGAHGVSPMELGFTIRSSGLGGKGFAEQQARTSNDRNIVLAHHFETIANKIMNGAGKAVELELVFPELEETDDSLAATQRDQLLWEAGVLSSDQWAEKLDMDAPGLGPTVKSGNAVVPIERILEPPPPPVVMAPNGEPDKTNEPGGAPSAVPGQDQAEPVQKAQIKTLVMRSLRRQYPEDLLGWVNKADWRYERAVPLSSIDYARRPNGRNPANVRRITDDMQQTGQTPPIVLVQTSAPKLKIADGWHRTLAAQHAGSEFIPAYVASGVGDHGPWDSEMLDDEYRKAELGRWQTKAIKALKLGKSAAVPFESPVVGSTADQITSALEIAKTPDDVRTIFAKAISAPPPTPRTMAAAAVAPYQRLEKSEVPIGMRGQRAMAFLAELSRDEAEDREALVRSAIARTETAMLSVFDRERERQADVLAKAAPPVIHVDAPTINVPAPVVHVHVPEQPPAVVNVAAAEIPAPVVNVPAPIVQMAAPKPMQRVVNRDRTGRITDVTDVPL